MSRIKKFLKHNFSPHFIFDCIFHTDKSWENVVLILEFQWT